MSPRAKVCAWLVHLYTAMGLVCAAGIAVLIVRGGDASFRRAFMLMLVATAIDATDGWLARKARVKDVLPGFSGRTLDDLVDFQTYTALPLLLLWRADALPDGAAWVLLAPLLASAYGFSQVNAKTDDGFFLGFPSYWNIVAFLSLHAPPARVDLDRSARDTRGADVRADAVHLRDPGWTVRDRGQRRAPRCGSS
jgi:phosphatidylcholine synthase